MGILLLHVNTGLLWISALFGSMKLKHCQIANRNMLHILFHSKMRWSLYDKDVCNTKGMPTKIALLLLIYFYCCVCSVQHLCRTQTVHSFAFFLFLYILHTRHIRPQFAPHGVIAGIPLIELTMGRTSKLPSNARQWSAQLLNGTCGRPTQTQTA